MLKPAQLCGPVARVKGAAGARVRLSLVKLTPQLCNGLRGARVGPAQHGCDGAAFAVNANKTVPETRDGYHLYAPRSGRNLSHHGIDDARHLFQRLVPV